MNRDTRDKASDVFRKSEYLFRQKVGFAEAFPQIQDLKIVVTREGEGVSTFGRVSHYGKDTGEYIDCRNPLCYNGGFAIGAILREMVREKKTHFEDDYVSCQGYEGSPKGKRNYGPCMNSFGVVIDITYKAGPSDS